MVKDHPIEQRQQILVITEVCVPVVDAKNCPCRGPDYSSSRSQDIYDPVEDKLDVAVLKQVHQFIRVYKVAGIILHPGLVLVTMYHWYLTSFVIRSIELDLYAYIVEEYVFALTEMGRMTIMLETMVVMVPVI